MKKVLVTGSSGKLGGEIMRQLREAGYPVLGIDIIESDTTDRLIDIRDFDKIVAVTRGIEAVIHTAAMHGKHYELGFPRTEFIATNIGGTSNLLNAAILNGAQKFLYTSTTSIYGKAMVDPEKAVWVDEDLVPDPRDIYDITKLTCELLCRDFFEKEGLVSVALRVSRFLHEDENTKAIHRLYRGLDESDGAAAHILALEKRFERFEVFNISNESPFQKADLVELMSNPLAAVERYFPKVGPTFAEKGWWFPEKIDRVYSIEKAKRELGYRPVNNFEMFLD